MCFENMKGRGPETRDLKADCARMRWAIIPTPKTAKEFTLVPA